MPQDEDVAVTREGLLTSLVGKVKQTAGELVGNDELADAGRKQQAEVEAEAEAVASGDEA